MALVATASEPEGALDVASTMAQAMLAQAQRGSL